MQMVYVYDRIQVVKVRPMTKAITGLDIGSDLIVLNIQSIQLPLRKTPVVTKTILKEKPDRLDRLGMV